MAVVSTTLMASSSVLCAGSMGRGDVGKTKVVFSLNITLTLIITSLISLIYIVVSKLVAGVLGVSPVNPEQAAGYVLVMGIGIIPLIPGQQFVSFLSLEGQNSRSFIDGERVSRQEAVRLSALPLVAPLGTISGSFLPE